jgi:alpha,alpha-trehalase
MIENLVSLLNQKGYVPNGGRKYYTRSQPPLLALMVWDYYLEVNN